tara:strand:- start:17988 stop:18455 length:468 start_codon:yes stop_codon:yes gene_type:complete
MKKEHLIIVIQYLFRFILGGLLVFAGILKVQDNTTLFESVAYIPWLSIGIKSLIIDFLPYIEIAAGTLLIFKIFDKVVLPLNGLIYLSFLIFAIWGLNTGLEIDCGCFGDLDNSSFIGSLLGGEMGWRMVIRNSIFVLMIGFLFLNPFTFSNFDQ